MANYHVEIPGAMSLDDQARAIEGEEALGTKFLSSRIWVSSMNALTNLAEFEELDEQPEPALGTPRLTTRVAQGEVPNWAGPMIVSGSAVTQVFLVRKSLAMRSALPATVASHAMVDVDIEALDLAPVARAAAYVLKQAHPGVVFTSGRRNKAEQARAMSSNVVRNRQWIIQTYKPSALCTQCQQWVSQHSEVTTQSEIAAGLLSILDIATDEDLGDFSKHLSGEAFDVQPLLLDPEKSSIKATIRDLPGLKLFLDKEGGLVRWHAQF